MALDWVSNPEVVLESVSAKKRRVLAGSKGRLKSPPTTQNKLLAVGKGPPKEKPAAEPGELALETIIGTDDRTRILATKSLPWRMICSLAINGQFGLMRGTGWLGGPRTIFTAGHCVFDAEQLGGWAQSIEIGAGRDDDEFPFPQVTATRFSALAHWVNDKDQNFDIGAIHLDEPLGAKVGWFSVGALPEAELQASRVNISGYPTRPGLGKQQWFHENRILKVTPQRIFYDVDTVGGQSGAPVWIYENAGADPTVVAVHAYGVGGASARLGIVANSAPRITSDVLEVIEAWLDKDKE